MNDNNRCYLVDLWTGFWIGMTDMEEEGVFKWRSNHNLSPGNHPNWGWAEPNNKGEENEPENCVAVEGQEGIGPYISDINCETMRPYICQKRGAEYAGLANLTQQWTEVVIIGVLAGVVVLLIGLLLYSTYKIHGLKKTIKVCNVQEYL